MIAEKKRTTVVLPIAIVTMVLLFIYAFVQKAEADTQRLLSIKNTLVARMNESRCQNSILQKDSLIHALEKEIETLKKIKRNQ